MSPHPPSDLSFRTELRAELVDRLAAHSWRQLPSADQRLAAVVLAVVPDASGQASIILTRRAGHLHRHSGQFALPGGRLDAGETSEQAGLRELDEEVGLALEPSSLLGRLDDFATRSGFLITPLVAWGGDGELSPDPNEVAALYRVPLAECGRPDALIESNIFADQPALPALLMGSVGTLVFSPTAAVIHQLAELAVHGRYTAVAHFEQPAFAWR